MSTFFKNIEKQLRGCPMLRPSLFFLWHIFEVVTRILVRKKTVYTRVF